MSGTSPPTADRFGTPVVRLRRSDHEAMLAHAYAGLPDEACALLVGPAPTFSGTDAIPDGRIASVQLCANADASARTYTVDPRDLIRALRAAEADGLDLVGVFHSHTHTDAWPSPTDVRSAHEPAWLYLIASLRHPEPALRAYRIADGKVSELRIVVEDE